MKATYTDHRESFEDKACVGIVKRGARYGQYKYIPLAFVILCTWCKEHAQAGTRCLHCHTPN